MLTRQGWLVAAGSAALLAGGRLFGIFELFMLGAGGMAVVVLAVGAVSLSRLRLDVGRELHPRRVHAGAASRVELKVRNLGRRRTPLLTLRDPVGRGRSAKVILAPLRHGQTVRADYRLPTERRGILTVGPLEIEVADPFGLASVRTPGAPPTELTIYPAIDEILPLPHTQGDDPHGGADHPNALSMAGEDFYALRQYEIGDDLRRVHWPATARHDELMVRQDEMPWQGRATILLDVRAAAHSPETLERAVSAAASIVVACRRRRFLLRLVATDGTDSGFAAGNAHVESIMERLATIGSSDGTRIQGIIASLRRSAGGGSLVALMGARGKGDVDAVGRLRRSFPHLTTVVFVPAPVQRSGVVAPGGAILVDPNTPFPAVWNAAIGRPGRVAAVAARP